VQRRGCRKAQIPVNHTEQIKRSLSRSNRNIIMIISKEMNHLIRLVDHNRRREKLLHKLKISTFHIVSRVLSVNHIAGLRRHRMDIRNAEGLWHELIHFSLSLMYVY